MKYFLFIAFVIGLDRLVKLCVTSLMTPGNSVAVIDRVFYITHVKNTGAAFSLWEGNTLLIKVIPTILLFLILVGIFVWKNKYRNLTLFSLSAVCGGGIGNLTDRIFFGHVTDMFDFRVFPVFNVADIFITGGCVLLALDIILNERKNKGV